MDELSTVEDSSIKSVSSDVNSDSSSSRSKSFPNVWNSGDPTDGRKKLDYESHYPISIRIQIALEAIYLVVMLIISFYLIFWIYSGDFFLYPTSLQFNELNDQLKRLVAFNIAGFIGGAMFGLKYLYHVAGRGWWHMDRRIWRICSPWLSASLATMIGVMLDGGLLGIAYNTKNAENVFSTFISIGFITGYFADTALAKLQEIANVVFGARSSSDVKK